MQKIAVVTGHTAGIGAEVTLRLQARGWEVRGCALDNEFDLWHGRTTIDRIVEECRDASLFVNNAHAGPAQTALLYAVVESWKRSPEGRHVVNIGSITGEIPKQRLQPYTAWKAALEAAVLQVQTVFPALRCSIVRLGTVDTAFSAKIPGPRMTISRACDAVMWVIDQPHDVLVRQVSLAPFPISEDIE